MIGNLDVQQALLNLWFSQGLNEVFKNFWTETEKSRFSVIHDQMADRNQPWPFCVYEASRTNTQSRSSGSSTHKKNQEIQETPILFKVHTRNIYVGDPKTSKQIAGILVSEIKKVFGGHPDFAPQPLPLQSASSLLLTYQGDYGMRSTEQEYAHAIEYSFLMDQSVAIIS